MSGRIEFRSGDVLVGEAAADYQRAVDEGNRAVAALMSAQVGFDTIMTSQNLAASRRHFEATRAEVARIAAARQTDVDWGLTSSRVTSPFSIASNAARAVAGWRAAGSPAAPARPSVCGAVRPALWRRPS